MTDINQFQPKSSHEIHTLRKLIVWRGGKQHQILEKLSTAHCHLLTPDKLSFFLFYLPILLRRVSPPPTLPN